jgi:hypothetical protein
VIVQTPGLASIIEILRGLTTHNYAEFLGERLYGYPQLLKHGSLQDTIRASTRDEFYQMFFAEGGKSMVFEEPCREQVDFYAAVNFLRTFLHEVDDDGLQVDELSDNDMDRLCQSCREPHAIPALYGPRGATWLMNQRATRQTSHLKSAPPPDLMSALFGSTEPGDDVDVPVDIADAMDLDDSTALVVPVYIPHETIAIDVAQAKKVLLATELHPVIHELRKFRRNYAALFLDVLVNDSEAGAYAWDDPDVLEKTFLTIQRYMIDAGALIAKMPSFASFKVIDQGNFIMFLAHLVAAIFPQKQGFPIRSLFKPPPKD